MTTADLVHRVLAKALSQVGVREQGGANRGPEVEAYLRRVHWRAGDPWCAAFVGWCGAEALGDHWPLPLVPGCATLGDFAFRHGLFGEPAPGAVFLLANTSRFHHTGFVIDAATPFGWNTVEGNTNTDGSAEGDGVYQRVRRFGARDGFIHWWNLLT